MPPTASLKSALWNLKLRLQFTGWLQYLPNALLALILGTIASIGWLIGAFPVLLFWTPLVLTLLLLANLSFDLVTVKLDVRPAERVPARLDSLDAFDLMRARESCRSFQSRDLTPEHHEELMDEVACQAEPAQQLGECSIRFEYVAVPLTVWPVVGAHEFLVAIAPREYDRMSVIDVGRSLQKVVHHATRMGLATCWIGPGADHESIQHQLGPGFDPERDNVICVCAVGYGSKFKPALLRLIQRVGRRRLSIDELFFTSPDLDIPLDPEAPPFDSFGRCYEVCQWAPSSFNGQTTRCAAVLDEQTRVTRFDFFATTDSRFYTPVALGIWLANWETGCEAAGFSGRFQTLGPKDRNATHTPELPRYDISWIRNLG
ncbi:MAG: nitroreductase [Deltaproteobacteria bacterium]|nr:nitroreductase [Deltaproteobacteria bacterium]